MCEESHFLDLKSDLLIRKDTLVFILPMKGYFSSTGNKRKLPLPSRGKLYAVFYHGRAKKSSFVGKYSFIFVCYVPKKKYFCGNCKTN